MRGLSDSALLRLFELSAADALSRPGRGGERFAPAQRIQAALGVVRGVDAGEIAAAHLEARDLPQQIRAARLKALHTWMRDVDAAPPA